MEIGEDEEWDDDDEQEEEDDLRNRTHFSIICRFEKASPKSTFSRCWDPTGSDLTSIFGLVIGSVPTC